jgi:hypothetical protein
VGSAVLIRGAMLGEAAIGHALAYHPQ